MKPFFWVIVFLLAVLILPQILGDLLSVLLVLLIFAIAWSSIKHHFKGKK